MWVYLNTLTGVHGFLSKGLNSVGWSIVQSGTTLYFEYAGTNITSSTPLVANKWTHIAVVRSGTGTNQTVIYVDGVSAGTGTVTTNFNDTNALLIGEYRQSGFTINAYVTDVRIVKGTAVYTTTFTPPSAPLTAISGTSLLTLQNNQPVNNSVFLDNSTNNFLVTRAGNATQGTFSPYGGNWSNYFGGQMVSTLSPSSTKFNLTGDFTLEAYVFLTALPGGDWGILDARTAGASPTSWLFGFNGSGKMQYYDGTARVGATTITLNTWHHVSWVRNGSVLRAYLNGVLDYYNGSYGTSAISPGSTAPVIGTKDYGISAAWGTTGYISNLRVVNGTAVYTTSSTTVGTTIFTPSTTPLTPIANTTLLTCADSRFIDDSINNYTITPSSSTISAQRFSPFNPSSVTPTSYSGYFDGTGDYLTVTNNVAFTFTNDFTIECWIYSGSNVPSNDAYPTIFSTSAFNSTGIGLKIQSSGGVGTTGVACVWNNGSQILTGTTVISNNNWYHLSVSRSGTSMKLFVNGVAENTITNNTTFTVSAGYPLVGGDTTIAGFLTGYVSNLRVVKGTAVYTSNFTPPTSPLTAIANTSLLTCQSTTFIDNSTNNFTITAFGNTQPTIQNPFGYTSTTTNGYTPSTIGGSGYFDGTGDTLNLASSTALLGAGNYTVEFWVNLPSAPTGGAYYTCFAYGASGSVLRCFILDSSGTKLGIWVGASNVLLIATTAMIGQWAHIAIVRSGSACTAYVNGVSIGTFTDSTNFNTGQLYIASQAAFSYLLGYISDFRIVVGTSIYNSNFVPPSAPLTAVQNTSLLTNMTGAGIYDASMMNNMESVGDAKLSTAVSKFGGTSMYFDGTGDYLDLPLSQNFSQTGSWTIEMWIYPTASNNCYLYSQVTSNFLQFNLAANMILYIDRSGVGNIITAGAAISLSTWTHIALVSEGTTVKLYINGTQSGSTASYSTTGASATTTRIGAYQNSGGSGTLLYTGYIDDFRITKGYARYTSNFTPPTSAFPIF